MSPIGAADLATAQRTVRKCYLVILANTIWLLIPLMGLLTGNNLEVIMIALVTAFAFLILSNNYLANHWYYYSDRAKGTIYKSHFDNIDHIGFITFFVTLISSLLFLMLSVIVANLLKSAIGAAIVLMLDVALTAILGGLAFWVAKRASSGLALAAKGREFSHDGGGGIFGLGAAGR